MIIKNVNAFGPDGTFSKRDLMIEHGVFCERSDSEEVLDAEGCYGIPGLVDIHFHGCMGHDFCDGTKEAVEAIAAYEASCGVLTICPATMTFPEEKLQTVMRVAADHRNESGADLVGINMEGPFISPDKKGAQKADYIVPPDVDMFRRLQKASGNLIRLVDLAPETEGAMDFIDQTADEVVLSIAHTMADYDTARQAMEHGVRHLTHFYNAMPPFTHRSPGVIGAAMDYGCEAELICDGVHLHPSAVRAAFRLLGEDKIIFISDSMEAAGMEDGTYQLGGQNVTVKGRLALLEEGDAIAGSATNLMDCMTTAVKEMGIPLETAVQCATRNPAASIGILDRYGSIENGKYGNLVLLRKDLSVWHVIQKGKVIR